MSQMPEGETGYGLARESELVSNGKFVRARVFS